jgi:hypothetical protein
MCSVVSFIFIFINMIYFTTEPVLFRLYINSVNPGCTLTFTVLLMLFYYFVFLICLLLFIFIIARQLIND